MRLPDAEHELLVAKCAFDLVTDVDRRLLEWQIRLITSGQLSESEVIVRRTERAGV